MQNKLDNKMELLKYFQKSYAPFQDSHPPGRRNLNTFSRPEIMHTNFINLNKHFQYFWKSWKRVEIVSILDALQENTLWQRFLNFS